MRLPLALATGLTTLVLSGCASSGAASSNAATPAEGVAEANTGAVRWSGSFTPTQQRTGNMSGADRARAYGNFTMSMLPSDRTRSRVRLTVTVPATAQNQSLQWALYPGRCGSGSLPVMAVNLFPPIEVGGNGRGDVSADLSLATPPSGSFHVNVFWPGGDQLENVMTCANLRRDG